MSKEIKAAIIGCIRNGATSYEIYKAFQNLTFAQVDKVVSEFLKTNK